MKRREITPLKLGEFRDLVNHCDVLERVEALPSGKRVLLPCICRGSAGIYTAETLRVVINDRACSVLITGEPGTGKEALFDCIKERSGCPPERVREINCASLGEQEADSVLFGRVAGAVAESNGLVQACENGILFLDEVGRMPVAVQAKLLRFMETGRYCRVGSGEPSAASHVRIVATTNQKVEDCLLPEFVQRFSHRIEMPALRERGVDVLWYLSQPGFFGDQSVFRGMSLRTLIGVLCHDWAGNVRDLANYCQRKIQLRPAETLEPNEREDILDDEVLARENGFREWVAMARAALAGAEKDDREHPYLADDPDRKEWIGFLCDIATWRGRNQSIDDPNHYSPGLVFDLDGLSEALFVVRRVWPTMWVPHWVRDAEVVFPWDDTEEGFSTQNSDSVAGMLEALRYVVTAMCAEAPHTEEMCPEAPAAQAAEPEPVSCGGEAPAAGVETEFLSAVDVGRLLNVSARTVGRYRSDGHLVADGKFPHTKKWRFTIDAVRQCALTLNLPVAIP